MNNKNNNPSKQETKSRDLTFAVPMSDDDCLKSSGPATAVAKAIASMVSYDGVITPDEYEMLAIVADVLSEYSDNRLLFRVLILNYLLEDISFDYAISELSLVAKNLPDKNRNLIFNAIKPLLIHHVTRDKKKITSAWIKALNLPKDKINEVVKTDTEGLLESDFMQNIVSLLSNQTDKNELAENLSNIFHDNQLNDAIKKYKNKKISSSEMEEEISIASKRALIKAESQLPSLKTIEEQEKQAQKFHIITETLIEQIRSRLKYTGKKLELQHTLFIEDFRAFLDSSLDSVEIGMRDLLEGRTDWADKTIWTKFSETDAYQRILLRFERWKNRYDRMFELWHAELFDFSKESKHTIQNILDNVDPIVFSGLVKTDHGAVEFKNQLDIVSNTTLGLAGLGAIGTVALILTEAVSIASIIPIILSPVGWVIGGAVGLSVLWKSLSNPEKRKRSLPQEKRRQLRDALNEILGDPITQHRRLIDEVEDNFFSVASNYYGPLARDARLAVLQAQLEIKIINKIKEDICTIFVNCAKTVSDGDSTSKDKIGQFAKSSLNKVLSFISRAKG